MPADVTVPGLSSAGFRFLSDFLKKILDKPQQIIPSSPSVIARVPYVHWNLVRPVINWSLSFFFSYLLPNVLTLQGDDTSIEIALVWRTTITTTKKEVKRWHILVISWVQAGGYWCPSSVAKRVAPIIRSLSRRERSGEVMPCAVEELGKSGCSNKVWIDLGM